MGDGHLRVAEQLRRRIVARGDSADVVDLMEVLPFKLGAALRGSYAAMLARAPWLYDAIYRGFFLPRDDNLLRPDPLVAASSPSVERLIKDKQPDVVVSTFHLCAQIVGRLRGRGKLDVPGVVVITDFVAHRMWLHPGNDAFVCVHPAVAADAERITGRRAVAAAPPVDAAFTNPDADPSRRVLVRKRLGLSDAPVALVSTGAWGTGAILDTVAAIADPDRDTLVLAGRNEKLRRRLESRSDFANLRVLGWRHDVADIMRASDVLIENAAGQTAMEALAVGLPVLTHMPLPGHGRDGARRMQDLGLSTIADDRAELRRAVAELTDSRSPVRCRQVAAGKALFTTHPVEFLEALARPVAVAAPPP